MGQFCHDLRQYISAGQLLARMPGDEELPAALRGRLETIDQVFDSLAAQVAAMAERSEPQIWPVNLTEVVEECVRVVTTTHHVAMVTELTDRATGYADPTLLRRAVVNVLDNACRAAGPEGRIRIRLRQGSEAARIEVSDDGPGFGAMPTVTGQGMAVVDRALRSCRGRLEIISGPGPGTTVRLTIPAHRMAAA
ncbi:MAG: sensor histidine kinase [Nocardioidaceae bacterium]